MELSKELTAASATPLILSILRRHDSYGYEMIKEVKARSANEIIWTEGMLYPVLHRLEQQGQIESYWGTSDAGRKRKYYRITDAGCRELDRQLFQWRTIDAALNQPETKEDANV